MSGNLAVVEPCVTTNGSRTQLIGRGIILRVNYPTGRYNLRC
jgi:hypothetical protein